MSLIENFFRIANNSSYRSPDLVFDYINPEEENSDFEAGSSLYMHSPFIRDIERSVDMLLNSSTGNVVPNQKHNDELAKYLIRSLGPFAPLWSSFCHPRETNSIVEAHNKVIKNDILRAKNVKPGRAIKDLRSTVLAQLKLERLHPLYKPSLKTKKISIEDPVEGFKKGPSPKITNFEKAASVEYSEIVAEIFNYPHLEDIEKALSSFEVKLRHQPLHIEVAGVKLNRHDIESLSGSNWINDTIIYAYLKLLCSDDKYKSQFIALDPYFFAKIFNCGVENSYPGLRKLPIFQYKTLIPICYNSHWTIAYFNPAANTLNYYDSLNRKGNIILEKIREFLIYKKMRDDQLAKTDDISLVYHKSPQQEGFDDCGIHVLINGRMIVRDKQISERSIEPDQVKACRKYIQWEIFNNQTL